MSYITWIVLCISCLVPVDGTVGADAVDGVDGIGIAPNVHS